MARKMKNLNDDIVVYCTYCKEPIFINEAYVVDNEEYYHWDCFNQMNTGIDCFGDSISYQEE